LYLLRTYAYPVDPRKSLNTVAADPPYKEHQVSEIAAKKDPRPPLGYSPKDVADSLGVHRKTILEAIKRKDLHAVRFGRRIVIPKAALDKFLEAQK